MKYDGIVLISDLDGTLLDDSRKLHSENIKAVADFVSKGGSFGVATGRMERTTILKFPELTINLPSIFFNGALICDLQKNEIIYSKLMPDGLDDLFQDFMNRYPTTGVEINTVGSAYVFNKNDIIEVQLEREGLQAVETTWDNIPEGWTKVVFADRHDILEEIKNDFDNISRKDINVVFSEYELLDIMSRDASKGRALEYLRELNKDSWRLVVAVGDNQNDLDMIRTADLGIAVANARECVKEAAKYVIADNRTPCIPKVLEILENFL